MLSYMNDKEALKWRETYVHSLIDHTTGEITFPTYKTFIELIEEYFKPADRVLDATHKLELLWQGARPVEEMVTEFQLLVAQAGMTDTTKSDNIHLIQIFWKALHPAISQRILNADEVPKKYKDGWTGPSNMTPISVFPKQCEELILKKEELGVLHPKERQGPRRNGSGCYVPRKTN